MARNPGHLVLPKVTPGRIFPVWSTRSGRDSGRIPSVLLCFFSNPLDAGRWEEYNDSINPTKVIGYKQNYSPPHRRGVGGMEMSQQILQVTGLTARIEEKELLHGVDLTIRKGETHVLMGPNGAGKSTLGYVLMGSPKYTVTDGSIVFEGQDITEESADKRARAGMFLSFQEPLEVPGLTLESFIRSALQQKVGHVRYYDFKKELARCMEILQMDPDYAQRSLNVGFSGGEKKKAEILQLMMLKPSLAILDETDSGLDVDAVRLVSRGIEEYRKSQEGALLIITHSTRILDALEVDRTHVMVNGRIVADGDGTLVDEINRGGYERFEQSAEA